VVLELARALVLHQLALDVALVLALDRELLRHGGRHVVRGPAHGHQQVRQRHAGAAQQLFERVGTVQALAAGGAEACCLGAVGHQAQAAEPGRLRLDGGQLGGEALVTVLWHQPKGVAQRVKRWSALSWRKVRRCSEREVSMR